MVRGVVRASVGARNQPLCATVHSGYVAIHIPLPILDRRPLRVGRWQRLLAVAAEIQKCPPPFVSVRSAAILVDVLEHLLDFGRNRV